MKIVLESSELADWELVQRKLRRWEFAEAEAFVRFRIDQCGLRPTYAALLARVLKRMGRYNEALSVLDEACELHPDSMRIYAEKGDTHFSRINYVRAAENYTAALAADAEDCMNPLTRELVQDNLAMSRYFLGDAASAAEQLLSLVVAHPEEARFRQHYAQALAQSAGDSIDIEDLPDIEDRYARDLSACLCRSLLDEKRFYDALRCSGQLVERYPDNPQAICCRSDVLFRLLRFDEAIDLLEDTLHRNVDASLYATLAKCYRTSNRLQLARGACLAGLFHFPNTIHLLVSLFEIDLSLGKMEECKKYCERIMAIPGGYIHVPMACLKYKIAAKFHGTFALPGTGEGRLLRSWFDSIKEALQLDWSNEHNPGKESLPNAETNDGPETAPLSLVFKNNSLALTDVKSTRYNTKHGYRVTVNQPQDYEYTVFIIGACMVTFGWCDSVTLGSAVQDIFNSHQERRVRVVNYGKLADGGYFENICLTLLYSDELQPGDKVLYYAISPTHWNSINEDFLNTMIAGYIKLRNDLTAKGVELYLGFTVTLENDPCRALDDDKLFEAFHELRYLPSRQHASNILASFANRLTDHGFTFAFFDHILQHKNFTAEKSRLWADFLHYSLTLNWPLAETMYEFLSSPATLKLAENPEGTKKQGMNFLANQAFDKFVGNKGIQSWVKQTYDADISNRRNVGAIVMNCNPFTLGHRYLVEQALESVETLYLFVVEEDLSLFSFADRLAMVEKGVGDLRDRVKAAPGGKFIISSFSFPEYFTKAVENTPADSTTDLLIFASLIAPALNIRTRFVGEEPTCLVTRSYNERMLQLLPDMGCAVRVIPRKEADGTAISASRVRKALEEHDLQSIKNLVPDTTYDYLAGLGKQ